MNEGRVSLCSSVLVSWGEAWLCGVVIDTEAFYCPRFQPTDRLILHNLLIRKCTHPHILYIHAQVGGLANKRLLCPLEKWWRGKEFFTSVSNSPAVKRTDSFNLAQHILKKVYNRTLTIEGSVCKTVLKRFYIRWSAGNGNGYNSILQHRSRVEWVTSGVSFRHAW